MFDGSPESLSLLFQIVGFVAVAVFTFLCRRRRWAIAIGPVFGLAINIIAQIVIAGGGPGACVSFVAFPLYGLAISWLTLKLARRPKRGD